MSVYIKRRSVTVHKSNNLYGSLRDPVVDVPCSLDVVGFVYCGSFRHTSKDRARARPCSDPARVLREALCLGFSRCGIACDAPHCPCVDVLARCSLQIDCKAS